MRTHTERLIELRHHVERLQPVLTHAAHCADADPSLLSRLLTNVHASSWLTEVAEARQRYRDTLADIAAFRRDAEDTIQRVQAELNGMRPDPAPLPGSPEYEQLARDVAEASAPRLDAERALRDLEAATVPGEPFLARVDAGLKVAAPWLLVREADTVRERCAKRISELAPTIERDVLEPLRTFERLTALASQVAGERVPAPCVVLPTRKAWESAAQAAAPRVEAAK